MTNKLELNKSFETLSIEEIQLVSFNISNEEFAFKIDDIQEIIKMVSITPVPLTKSYVEGVINIRGNIIPVVDLRKKMEFDSIGQTPKTRIIVVSYNKRNVGFIVDNMNEVIKTNYDKLHPPLLNSNEDNNEFTEYIYSVEERLITILSLKKLLR